jgi:hypothetical protein
MASRQEEKEARRQARLEQEAKEAKSRARNRRLQLVLGGVLVALIIAGVVIGISASGGDDKKTADSTPTPSASSTATPEDLPEVTLPAQATADEAEAADAAGCTTSHPADEGRGHEDREFTPADYDTNPPTSGTHFPEWAQDGIYPAGSTPALGMLVHTLEHGRINFQYRPGTSAENRAKLEKLFEEANEGYHTLLYENTTDMDAAVAATAWDWMLTCPDINDKTWDALRTFRDEHIDEAPERVP